MHTQKTIQKILTLGVLKSPLIEHAILLVVIAIQVFPSTWVKDN